MTIKHNLHPQKDCAFPLHATCRHYWAYQWTVELGVTWRRFTPMWFQRQR